MKNVFPFLYYAIGIKLRDYKTGNIKTLFLVFMLIATVFIDTLIYQLRFLNTAVDTIPNGYGTLDRILVSCLIYLLSFNLLKDSSDNKVIIEISNATLVAYLVSEVVDISLRRFGFFSTGRSVVWILLYMPFIGLFSITVSILANRYLINKLVVNNNR